MTEILIVEDEYAERQELARQMQALTSPECIRCAPTCDTALQMIAELCPDVILLDIMLRGRSGFEVARFVRSHQLKCKIIILTAYNELDFANQALELNLQDYLLKPVRPAVLLQRIRKVLQSPVESAGPTWTWPYLECSLAGGPPLAAQGVPDLVVLGVLDTPLSESDQAAFLAQCSLSLKGLGWMEVYRHRVFGYCRTDQAQIHQTALRFCSVWSDALPAPHRLITVGEGSFASTPDQLSESYHTAHLAAKSKLFQPQEAVCRYSPWRGPLTPYPRHQESSLLYHLRAGSREDWEALCRQLCQRFLQNSHGDIRLLERWLGLLCAGLSRLCAEAAIDLLPQPDFLRLPSPQALEDWLTGQCAAIHRRFTAEDTPDHPLVQAAIALIQARYQEQLKLKDVARELYVNPAYLGRLFHRQTGALFRDYLTQVRMQQANQLLQNHQSISAVAAAVGFDDPNYFSRVYRKQFGYPPKDGRQQV